MGWMGLDGSLGLGEYRAPYGANNLIKDDRSTRKIILLWKQPQIDTRNCLLSMLSGSKNNKNRLNTK